MRPAPITLLVLLLATATRVAAQQPEPLEALPDSIAYRVVAIYNQDGTLRLSGESEIAPGTGVDGAVAALNGPLRIAGSVEGDVVVINGDVELAGGARVTGDVIAVGGSVLREAGAQVNGRVLAYREPLRFRYQDGRLRYVPPHLERGLSAGREWRFGRADLYIAAHGSYNRVEGLPVAFGPRLRLGGGNPTRLQALAIYRTGVGLHFDIDDMGYDLAADQQIGVRGLNLGVRLFSEVEPVESWSVSDRESSLAAFLLHRDYRDHYDRTGWAVGVHLDRPDLPVTAELWYRDETHDAVAPREPWTILDNEEPWRPEPLVAEGRLRSALLSLRYDTRNDPDDASFGWLIQATAEQGIGGSLSLPGDVPGAATARTGFNAMSVDVRRYLRLSPYAQFAIRGMLAGSIDGKALPPQRQHALGGEGSLPAFGLLQFDCGARAQALTASGAFPYYGCDRMALVQLEYQASFPIARRLLEKIGIAEHFTNTVRWSAFFDTGRAWTRQEAREDRGVGLSDFAADAGVGLRVGPLGAYWAVPLSAGDKRINFFVRIGTLL